MGKTRGAHKWNHIERETGLLARGALTLAANTAGVYMYVAIRNGVVAQQKVD